MSIDQLVLPSHCRKTILSLAHEIPLAGHLGQKKTAERILQRFYWPTLFQDVREVCKACPECQRTASGKTVRAPMIPLPIIEEPFQHIAMDIVGPLPRSRQGHRYILVICDYATRYPEAFPLKTIDAPHVAEELMKFFSRVGVPKEILTDQGTNFMSKLLTELYRMLHIQPIHTSPYHPQTDGLVERFNRTLKAMLNKLVGDEGKYWDRLLPYLLFAYREVPQASTGFSPFELVYGRQVRGPLDIIKESWEADKRSNESVVSHVLTVQDRLSKMSELARENLRKAQTVQKRWYDKNSRERTFQAGEQVLVLLPSTTNKLLAQWQGPYPVIRKITPVTYEVDMFDHKKRKRMFHVNMLKKWNIPTLALWTESKNGTDETEDDLPSWKDDTDPKEAPKMGPQLANEQRSELQELLDKFLDILSNCPGKTDLIKHEIHTTSSHPIRLPPHRIPHAYKDMVQQELGDMLSNGIIEPSTSEWSSPIVLVKKTDGTLRFCIDFRRLNSISEADAYPMPRIDNLIDCLGQAKYISTLDLTRGYWQVPLSENARAKTAFATQSGLYQFTVMPFGLKGAPATFQRLMDTVLQGLDNFAAAYLDDVIIHSNSWSDHLSHLQQVFDRIRKAKLTVKQRKCQFAMERCNYLGHIVGSGQVQPDPSKLEAVKTFTIPKSKKEVRVFLGLTGYYRKFINNYSSLAAPLSDLTRKDIPNKIPWSDSCDRAFNTLKQILCSNPVLKTPDFSKPFILQTDASNKGVGAILSQIDDNSEEHPVGFFSRKLLPREQQYAIVEKECLAIKLGVEAFKVYLLGCSFTIWTDHRSLEWLERLKGNNSRLTRWSLALQPYSFTVKYRKGVANHNADALPRLISEDSHAAKEGEGSVKD